MKLQPTHAAEAKVVEEEDEEEGKRNEKNARGGGGPLGRKLCSSAA